MLLTQREDFEVWCLSGGGVKPGESLAQAAIREVREETGIEVELARLVGTYSRPWWMGMSQHIAVFTATQVGGVLQPQPGEVIALDFFDLDAMPLLLWGQRQRIQGCRCRPHRYYTSAADCAGPAPTHASRDLRFARSFRPTSNRGYKTYSEQYGPEDQQIEVPGVMWTEH